MAECGRRRGRPWERQRAGVNFGKGRALFDQKGALSQMGARRNGGVARKSGSVLCHIEPWPCTSVFGR